MQVWKSVDFNFKLLNNHGYFSLSLYPARVNISQQFWIMKIRNVFTLSGFTFILFCFEKVILNGISFFLLIFCFFFLQKMSRFEAKCHICDMFVTFFCSNVIF